MFMFLAKAFKHLDTFFNCHFQPSCSKLQQHLPDNKATVFGKHSQHCHTVFCIGIYVRHTVSCNLQPYHRRTDTGLGRCLCDIHNPSQRNFIHISCYQERTRIAPLRYIQNHEADKPIPLFLIPENHLLLLT